MKAIRWFKYAWATFITATLRFRLGPGPWLGPKKGQKVTLRTGPMFNIYTQEI